MKLFLGVVIITYFLLHLVIIIDAANYRPLSLVSLTRIYDTYQCDDQKIFRISKFERTLYNVREYYNVNVTVLKNVDITNLKMSGKFTRCDCEGYHCEHHLSIDNVYLKTFTTSDLYKEYTNYMRKKIVPPIKFPFVKQGDYQFKNFTVFMEDMTKFYPEITKYYWKIKILATLDNEIYICYYYEGKVVTYRERVKTKH